MKCVNVFLVTHFCIFMLGNTLPVNRKNPCHNQVPCDNLQCIDKEGWCNDFLDCGDDSDEEYCTEGSWWNPYPNNCTEKHFICSNGMCVPKATRCDGYPNCLDGSDEENCVSPKEEEKVNVQDMTRTVPLPENPCHNQVPCDNLQCIDKEGWCNDFLDCGDGSDEEHCTEGSWLALYRNNCTEKHFICSNGMCVPKVTRCDGYPNCLDGSDEENCVSPKEEEKVNVQDMTRTEPLPGIEATLKEEELDVYEMTTGSYETPNASYTTLESLSGEVPSLMEDKKLAEDALTYDLDTSTEKNDTSDSRPHLNATVHESPDTGQNSSIGPTNAEVCGCEPRGLVPWILHVRKPDYGWGEDTPIATIALAVNRWKGTPSEMMKMDLQLEMEILKALMRNQSSAIHEVDISLFIHALIARSKNPRNFHGVDLVADLLHRAKSVQHTFMVLALCNSNSLTFDDMLSVAHPVLFNYEYYGDIELIAATLKIVACQSSIDPKIPWVHKRIIDLLSSRLKKLQKKDGSFGNVYTTSLAVQALISCCPSLRWDKEKALNYLRVQSFVDISLKKAYYIEMALNAEQVKFIKNLCPSCSREIDHHSTTDSHYVMYSVMFENNYSTISFKVPCCLNFYEIMKISAQKNPYYKFEYFQNEDGNPDVYSIAGKANDAEKGMFWSLCVQKAINHDNHTYTIEAFPSSPNQLILNKSEHAIFRYGDSDCTEGFVQAFRAKRSDENLLEFDSKSTNP